MCLCEGGAIPSEGTPPSPAWSHSLGYGVRPPRGNTNNIEQLRDSTGKKVCGTRDLDYIRKEYNIIPFKGKVKKLGSTGIKLYYDTNLNKFVIER